MASNQTCCAQLYRSFFLWNGGHGLLLKNLVMNSWKEKLYHRLMIQLSDVPWMLTAGVIGFSLEMTMIFLGVYTFSSAWWFWLKVIGIYSFALGYTSFRFNLSWPGFILGALTGLIYELVNAYYYPIQIWNNSLSGNFLLIVVLAMTVYAVVPYLTDRIVNRWLLRGTFRWLASHHPRYSHLKE